VFGLSRSNSLGQIMPHFVQISTKNWYSMSSKSVSDELHVTAAEQLEQQTSHKLTAGDSKCVIMVTLSLTGLLSQRSYLKNHRGPAELINLVRINVSVRIRSLGFATADVNRWWRRTLISTDRQARRSQLVVWRAHIARRQVVKRFYYRQFVSEALDRPTGR